MAPRLGRGHSYGNASSCIGLGFPILDMQNFPDMTWSICQTDLFPPKKQFRLGQRIAVPSPITHLCV